jgi:pyruvate kinase
MGPAVEDPEVLRRLIGAGISAARVNYAHGDRDDHAQWIARVRKVSAQAGRPVAVLADLGGPKVRVRGLAEGRLDLKHGDTVELVAATNAEPGAIPVSEKRLVHDVRPKDPVFLADGSIELEVLERSKGRVTCRVVTGGLLLEGKGVNVPNTRLRLPSLTDRDRRDLGDAIDARVDAVALSFVRKPGDLAEAQKRLKGTNIPLLAKIEKAEAVRHLEGIIEAADGVMVARGDLGVETPLVEIPTLQKRIIRLANRAAKPVITATQMMRSMVENPHPTRAEATDVANAILDGTDAVMLSEETAVGKHPVRAVETMDAIARHVEQTLPSWGHEASREGSGIPKAALAVSHSAMELAEAVDAKAIVVPTRTGASARYVARLRPQIPVLAIASETTTQARLHFTWGVLPVRAPRRKSLEETVRRSVELLRDQGLVKPGDAFVLVAGFPPGTGDSNLVTVQTVPGTRQAKTRRASKAKA